jgi:hypothetical protein
MKKFLIIALISINLILAKDLKEFLADVEESTHWFKKDHEIYQSSLNTMFNSKENDIFLSLKYSNKTAYFKLYIGKQAAKLLKKYYIKEKKKYDDFKSKLLEKMQEEGIEAENEGVINRVLNKKGFNITASENINYSYPNWYNFDPEATLIWQFYDKDGFVIDEEFYVNIDINNDLNEILEIQDYQTMLKEDYLRIHYAKLLKVSFQI